jgi:hypothetical protein
MLSAATLASAQPAEPLAGGWIMGGTTTPKHRPQKQSGLRLAVRR